MAAVGSGRSLLMGIFGEFVLPTRQPVWTSSLLHVAGGLGIEPHSARQAIARAVEANWIVGQKEGRQVRLSLTDVGVAMLEPRQRRMDSTPPAPVPPWDGQFVILFLTIPKDRAPVRKSLYKSLSRAGFGSPMPGLWVSPHVGRAAETATLIEQLGVRDQAICFLGSAVSVGLAGSEIVERGWDLQDASAQYERFIESFQALDPDPGDDVLLAYLALTHEWHRLVWLDPHLPEELLPDWAGRRAASLFLDLRRRWREHAHARWSQLGEPASR
jgi:phenylacetic acid degradation operon negative regulatory protein